MSDFERLAHEYYHQRVASAWGKPRATEPVAHSDIVLHLPVLEWLASRCWHVTEFGVREAHSTVALVRGCPGEVHSYDRERSGMVGWLYQRQDQLPCRWVFHEGDTGDPRLKVAETDLLLLDTAHTERHLGDELRWHGRKARRYLVFHDTARYSCGAMDLSGPDPTKRGILPAIEKFMADYPREYSVWYQTSACNGLLVLERRLTPWYLGASR